MFGAQTTLHITSLPRSKLSVSPGIISFVTVFFGCQNISTYKQQLYKPMLVTSGQKGALRVDWNQVFEVLCLLFFVGQGRNLMGEIDFPKMTGMFTG